MIDIIYVRDVFAEHPETHITSKQYIAGMTLNGYVDLTDRDAYVAGMWVKRPETFCPKDKMQVLVVPHVAGHGFKKFLGTVLTVGLLIAAPHWTFGITSLWARSLVTGAVLILGGKIINSVFHLNQAASRGVDDRSSTTYGWDLPSVQTQEGNVIGETFGECIPSPQLLMCHVETADENTQYLNVLYCGGYGPVDSIKDIRIEHTPIENFADCQIETRLGTNDQTAISFFPDTVADQSIDLTLKEGVAVIRSTDSDEVNKLEVTVTFPSGIYYQKDDGNLGNLEVRFNIAYRVTGTSNWVGNDYALSRATNQAVRKVYTFSGLAANRYDVKVTPITTPITSRSCGLMQWSTLSSYSFTGAFTHPNKVLVGMRVKATSQLNGGVPSINWRQRRTVGYVWDPNKQEYVTKDLRNPIWAAYDILHHCRKLYNINTGDYEYHVDGCPKERFTQYFDQWVAAADYADEEVTDADGTKEPRFRFDAYYDTSLRRYEAANKALAVGHATLVRHGLQLGVVVDRPGTIHQVFGEGRTIASSIKGEFSATEDRAHSLEVTYNDTENDFKNTEFFIRSDSYASAAANGQDNTAQLTLFGVSSRSQAYREAMYALATNERQLQTIQFSADVNAFVCEYGDLIGINSQVPRLGVASGRIVSVDGTTVKLDKTVTFKAREPYTVMFQKSENDALITRDVTAFTADTTTDTITVTTAFDSGAAPVALDNYVLGLKDKAVKPFRITKIERDGDQKVAITAVEYDDAVFDTDYSKYPKIDYSTPPMLMAPINVGCVEQVYKNYAGVKASRIYISWDTPENAKYDEFHVYYSTDGENWTRVTNVVGTCATVENVMPPLTYQIKVCSVIDGVESKFTQTSIKVTGHVEPAVTPVDIIAFEKYTFLSDGTPLYAIELSWGPDKLTGQVYYKHTGSQVKDVVMQQGVPLNQAGYSADWTFAGIGTNQITISPVIPGEKYKICVCTADELGLYTDADSAPYTEISVEPKTLIPNTPDNVELTFDTASHLRWDSVTNCDIQYYEIRLDTDYGNETDKLLARTNRLSTTITLKERKGTVYVFACSTDNKYSRPAVVNYNKVAPDAPTLDAVAGIGQIRLQVGPIPGGALGVHFYVDDQAVETPNAAINYMVKKAGEYDVSAAYYDLFGDGAKCPALHVYVKNKVDTEFLEKNAVALENVDATIKKAVEDTQTALPSAIQAAQDDVNKARSEATTAIKGVIDELNKAPGDSSYRSISSLKTTADSISATVANNKTAQDGTNQNLLTKIEANTSGINTVVANLNNTDASKTGYKAISALKQQADSISSTVANNKTATDGSISTLTSKVSQQADQITSIVSDVKAVSGKTESNYSAIVQNQSDIALRVKKGEIIGQINATPETATIDFKHLNITGATLFQKDITISETEKGGLVGGSVRIDNKGMTVNNTNGTAVSFGKNGMEFIDTNGVAFNTVGRLCTGTAYDGQTIVFAKPWDVKPNVFVFPVYQNYKINKYLTDAAKQRLRAENVTKEGFSVVFNTYVDGTEVNVTTPDELLYSSDKQTYAGTELTYVDTKPEYSAAWYRWSKTLDIPLGFAASSVTLGVASMHTLKPFSEAAYALCDGKSGWEVYKVVSQTGTRNGKNYNKISYSLEGHSSVGFDVLDDNGAVLKSVGESVRSAFNSSFIENDDTSWTVKETMGFGTGSITTKFTSTMNTIHLRIWENLYLVTVVEYVGDNAAVGLERVVPSPSSDITKALSTKIYISNPIYVTKSDGETILDRGVVGFIATDPNSVNYTLK